MQAARIAQKVRTCPEAAQSLLTLVLRDVTVQCLADLLLADCCRHLVCTHLGACEHDGLAACCIHTQQVQQSLALLVESHLQDRQAHCIVNPLNTACSTCLSHPQPTPPTAAQVQAPAVNAAQPCRCKAG